MSSPVTDTSPPPATRVLVVDDEPGLREILRRAFLRSGYDVVEAAGMRQAVEALRQSPQPFPLVLTDLAMPDLPGCQAGMQVLRVAKERSPATEVIVMTAHGDRETALEAMRLGAYDFVNKPFASVMEMILRAGKALEKSSLVTENQGLRAHLERLEPHEGDLVGASPAMQQISELLDKVAGMRTTVLITGESGTGKERIARSLHDRSDRASKPFLVVSCGALPEALMESELFGHEKGSFTGAGARTLGMFREADGGTLLLDEVGELPMPLQVKLLRVLQERKVRPVGGTVELPVDVRVLAATNRDVEAEVREGRFRQDLYYRLNVIRIELPPLRERPGDVARLVDRFIRRFAAEFGKDIRGVTPDALRALDAYPFPGNVRELENMMERAVALASGPSIGLGDLPAAVSGLSASPAPLLAHLPEEGCNLDEVLGEVERRLLLQALDRTGGIRKSAAKLLGVTFRSLRYRLSKHALGDQEGDDDDDGPVTNPGRELSPRPARR
jgi:two-component system response regulator PilR (NtrC family)